MGTTTTAGQVHGPARPTAGKAGGGVVLAFAVAFAAGFSFLFHAVASRVLNPDDYGGLAALLALMVASVVPIAAGQAAVTRSAAGIGAVGARPSGRHLLARGGVAALATMLVGAGSAPLISDLVRLDTTTPALLMALWLAVNVPEAVVKGLLIGTGRLRAVALAIIAGAVFRVAAFIGLATLDTGWSGPSVAMSATVLAEAAMMAMLAWSARQAGLLDGAGARAQAAWRDAGRALNCQLALWLYSAAAAVLARAVLGSTSGSFAAMVTAAAACVYLPQAVATVAFPRFVADARPVLLLKALGLAAGVSVVCGLILLAQPHLVFSILFGADYRPDRLTLGFLTLHSTALGCLTVIAQYLVAGRRRGTWALWAALGVGGALAARFGGTEAAFAGLLALGSSAAATGFAALAFARWRAERPARSFASPRSMASARSIASPRSIAFTEPAERFGTSGDFPPGSFVAPRTQP